MQFEHIQRRFDARIKAVVATLHPGDYYVSTHAELISTVLGSCVSACMRDPRLRIGGMNHFMLPGDRREGSGVLGWRGPARPASATSRWSGWSTLARSRSRSCRAGGEAGRWRQGARCAHRCRCDATSSSCASTCAAEGFRVIGEDLGDVYPRKVLYDPASGSVRGEAPGSQRSDAWCSTRSAICGISSVCPKAGRSSCSECKTTKEGSQYDDCIMLSPGASRC